MSLTKTDHSTTLHAKALAQTARLQESRARLEALHGPIPPLSPEARDRSEMELHNHLRRGGSVNSKQ